MLTGVGFSRRSRFAANQYFLPQVKDGLHMLPSSQPLCKRTCVLRAHLVFLLLTGRHGFYSGGDGKVAGTWLVVCEAGWHMADQLVANLLFPLPCEKYIDLLGDFTIIL